MFDSIAAGFENTLSLDGTTPNSMGADIDLNSNDLLNVQRVNAVEFVLDGELLAPGNLVAESASQLTFTPAGSGAVATTVQDKLRESVSVKDFGATGDGVTDDTAAIQAAIDSSNNIFVPEGTYLISRSTSADGHTNYGLVIDRNDITFFGVKGKTLFKRFDTDISTYALAYTIFHIGGVEVSDTSTTSDIVLRDFDIYGNDTRHAVSGSALTDLRTGIQLKGAVNAEISNIIFREIDSTAIVLSPPKYYSYITSTTQNLGVYNENVNIHDCTFYGNVHAVTGRALLHAILCSGVNTLTVANNHFSWCDNCIAGSSTYDVEGINGARNTATYTDGGVNYLRCGREILITGNTMRNSSEHSIYSTLSNVVISNNVINVDSAVCHGDIRIRGQHVVVSGNSLVVNEAGITISTLARDVTVTGNTIMSYGDTSGGVIDISSNGIKAYIDARPHYDTSVVYPLMQNIVVTGNIITMEDVTHTYGFGVRLYTDVSSVVGYPDGTMIGVSISDNTFDNVRVGVFALCPLLQRSKVSNNIFRGGLFTKTSFTGSDLKGYCVIAGGHNYIYNLIQLEFNGNTMEGFEYVFGILNGDGTVGGGGAVLYYRPTASFRMNTMSYFKDLSLAYGAGGMYAFNSFNAHIGNVGTNFIAKNAMITSQKTMNSYGLTGVSASASNGQMLWDGTNLRYYTDDVSTFQNL